MISSIGCLRSSFVTIFAVAAIAAPAQAQRMEADTLPTYKLEGVTVTTTRSAVDRDRIPQKIEVIGATAITRSPAADVAEVLRQNAAVDVIQYPGLLTGVSIRGFRPQYSGISPRTLVLFNGRPAGTTNLALLSLSNVERIEVLRGPASSLFGSSAMGGVVNIITRHSAGGIRGNATAGYGTYGAFESRVRAGGTLAPGLDFDLAVGSRRQGSDYTTGSKRTFGSDSLRKSLPDGTTSSLPLAPADTSISFTQLRSVDGSARIGYVLAERWRIDVSGEGLVADGVQNPGDIFAGYDNRSVKDVERRSAEVALTGRLARSLPSLRLFSALETLDYYNAPDSPNFVNYRTPVRTRGGQLQNVLRLGRGELTLGADYTESEGRSEAFTAADVAGAPYSPDSEIRSTAGFGQIRADLLDERLSLTGGARVDRVMFAVLETPNLGGYPANEERHLVVSPSAGLRYSIGSGVQLYGNAGKGFVAPDAFNVAGYSESRAGQNRQAVSVTRGNPDLRPESSTSWDAGIRFEPSRRGASLELTYFETSVRDRITGQILPASGVTQTSAGDTIVSTTTYVNADKGAIRGLEGEASFDLGVWLRRSSSLRLFATGTRLLTAEERFTANGVTQRIRNVADLTLLAGVDFDDLERFSGRLTGRYVGERVDSDYVAWWAPGEIEYPQYLVLDLTAAMRVADRYRIGVEVLNLADEDYFEVRGYNLPGRTFRIVAAVDF